MTSKPTSYQRGIAAEAAAKAFLEKAKYTIIAERYRNAGGEIDLIASQKNLLIFVEVKARKSEEDGLYAITPHQQKRILRAAEGFLAQHPEYSDYDMRFDAVIIPASGLPSHLEYAFMAA